MKILIHKLIPLVLTIYGLCFSHEVLARERRLEIDQVKRYAISAVRPEYPYNARARGITGKGVYILHVNAHGLVSNVTIESSSGSGILDIAATSAFKRWRFKPFGKADVRAPVTGTMPRR